MESRPKMTFTCAPDLALTLCMWAMYTDGMPALDGQLSWKPLSNRVEASPPYAPIQLHGSMNRVLTTRPPEKPLPVPITRYVGCGHTVLAMQALTYLHLVKRPPRRTRGFERNVNNLNFRGSVLDFFEW